MYTHTDVTCKFQYDPYPVGHPGYCFGNICYAVRFLNTSNQPVTTYACFNKLHREDWNEICDGSQNSEDIVYQCCDSTDRCNEVLSPRLPMELVTEPVQPTTGPGGECTARCSCDGFPKGMVLHVFVIECSFKEVLQ